MRISCPSCGAAYDVPETKLAPGRQVRCVKCNTMWAPVPLPEPEPPPVETVAPEVAVAAPAEEIVPPPVAAAPVDDTVAEPDVDMPLPPIPVAGMEPADSAEPAPPRRRAVGAGWLLSLVVMAGLAYGAVAYRAKVMQAWPPSARAYAWLGLGG